MGLLTGLAIVLPGIRTGSAPMTVVLMMALVFLGAFGLSIGAGLLLLRGDMRGVPLSIFNQALQVPMIATPLLEYFYFTGLQLGILVGTRIGFQFNVGGGVHIMFPQQGTTWAIGVNLIAAVFLAVLLQARRAPRSA